ncbi:hypothetical protein TNCV_2028871 [Trichonephila clavipes]|nr:hypothetical protein TNCV_2028871 [Trichonephila clavipes]
MGRTEPCFEDPMCDEADPFPSITTDTSPPKWRKFESKHSFLESKFGTWSSAHQQCVLFAPDPVTAARLETQCVPRHRRPWGLSWSVSKRMGALE